MIGGMNRQVKTERGKNWFDLMRWYTNPRRQTRYEQRQIREHYRREIKTTLLEDLSHQENDGYAFHLPEWMPNDPAPQGFWTNYNMDRFDDDCIFDYDDGWGDMTVIDAKVYHSDEADQAERELNRLDYL